jgi:hypothetical protein
MFSFGASPQAPPPQVEEADDNPDIQNLQIEENHLQVAAVGALQVAAGGALQVAAGGAAGGAAGDAEVVNFPLVNYFNGQVYTPARLCFNEFSNETKTAMTFGGTSFISCGATSRHLKFLNSKLHMQYLLMVDTHFENTKKPTAVYEVNQFLFGTFVDVLHPTRMVMFRIYKNFRDYIFKPVFLALYSNSLTTIPKNLISEPMKEELFTTWLTCTV